MFPDAFLIARRKIFDRVTKCLMFDMFFIKYNFFTINYDVTNEPDFIYIIDIHIRQEIHSIRDKTIHLQEDTSLYKNLDLILNF